MTWAPPATQETCSSGPGWTRCFAHSAQLPGGSSWRSLCLAPWVSWAPQASVSPPAPGACGPGSGLRDAPCWHEGTGGSATPSAGAGGVWDSQHGPPSLGHVTSDASVAAQSGPLGDWVSLWDLDVVGTCRPAASARIPTQGAHTEHLSPHRCTGELPAPPPHARCGRVSSGPATARPPAGRSQNEKDRLSEPFKMRW